MTARPPDPRGAPASPPRGLARAGPEGLGSRAMSTTASIPIPNADPSKPQLLHLVFGGELDRLDGVTFRDLNALDVVGIFPDYDSARAAWKAKAQATVDSAQTRYFIVHLHRLLAPEAGGSA